VQRSEEEVAVREKTYKNEGGRGRYCGGHSLQEIGCYAPRMHACVACATSQCSLRAPFDRTTAMLPLPHGPKEETTLAKTNRKARCCPGARMCGSRTVVHPARALHRPPEVPQPYNDERTTATKISAAAARYFNPLVPKTPSPAVEHVFCPACCPAGATGGRLHVEWAPCVSLVVGTVQDAHAERPALASADVGGEVVAEGPLAADGPWRRRSPLPYAPKASTRRRPILAVTAAFLETAVAVACVDGATVPAL